MPDATLDSATSEKFLSAGRLGVYLAAAENDQGRALRLYEWNASITAVLLHDAGHLEVLLRNRYDLALSAAFPGWTSPTDSLWKIERGLEAARIKQRRTNQKSRTAIEMARRGTRTHGHVVANLTFGFWCALTRAERESTIWTPVLSPIFAPRARGQIHDEVEKLNAFRNRLAHWEPVFSRTTGLVRQLQRVDSMFRLLDSDVAAWVGERSTALEMLHDAPEPLFAPWTGTYLGRTAAVGRS
ncbi:MAG TPA: hypothetical protein VIP82_22550 [Microbacterium sp.]|uniref:hypothetical protein n=1 Tax=Microbacterium sp. TaxID=51671 RepID=UPI002F91F6D0